MTCLIEGCTHPGPFKRNYCNAHYLRLARHGDPEATKRDSWPGMEERFWIKVERDGPLPVYAPELGPCWIWTAYLNPAGYGEFNRTGYRAERAHRIAYELLIGLIPNGLQLDHLCRVPACVNPAHLEPVTMLENIDRSPRAAQNRTHCPQGHEYSDANTYHGREDNRACRTCHRERERLRRQRMVLHPILGDERDTSVDRVRERWLMPIVCAKCGRPALQHRNGLCREDWPTVGSSSGTRRWL